MSTNDHHHPPRREPAKLVDELAARRHERLEELLRQRARLSVTVAERMAHELSDSEDYLHELLRVEQAIEASWPTVYEQLAFGQWLFADMALMHNAGEPHPVCSICTAAAASPGTPPQPDTPGPGALAGPLTDEAA